MLFSTGDNADSEKDNKEDDNEEEPKRADDDIFVHRAFYTFVFYIIDDVEDADARSAVPSDAGKVGVAWHNPEGLRVFFVGEDFFTRKERKDLEGLSGGGVDVALVGDGGMTGDFTRK